MIRKIDSFSRLESDDSKPKNIIERSKCNYFEVLVNQYHQLLQGYDVFGVKVLSKLIIRLWITKTSIFVVNFESSKSRSNENCPRANRSMASCHPKTAHNIQSWFFDQLMYYLFHFFTYIYINIHSTLYLDVFVLDI